MSVEIKVPILPESVSEATVATWHKQVGDAVSIDENIVDIETEKVVLEVPSTVNGVIKELLVEEGATVGEQDVIAIVEEGASAAAPAEKAEEKAPEPAAKSEAPAETNSEDADKLSPAVRKMLAENNLSASAIKGTGKNGRILKEDVLAHLENASSAPAASSKSAAPAKTPQAGERNERRVPMTRLRATIARRLKEAQDTQAMLTTFNDVNLQAVIDLRSQYKELFEKKHGTRLGFMSFFVKAAIEALKRFPAVNASIDGNDIVYHDYYDVGIAASSPRGLVVPVLRDVDQMSFADVEKNIGEYGQKAKDGKLTMEDLVGGTFTVSNGGVFGSMLSTPIVNPPQSAILGMHRIEERPVAENGQVVIRPMMYLALTYDHRIIDGKESVLFLRTIKECLEDPARLLLEL
ncbi:dihydrolipoyllysine-residue succinyltransferase component of 2-oxoglutarate dehydrogenase complex [Arenicella chitinivorans]|uniref:Dihydrolipoyllysine-residue succinyltransferase component of 2-oxoglutarate dehydrogenase complex n=1 Tax=Arenicella chitinivorans TaxID=1329800 RepID=A0A918VR78_9GAMM|nr:2-oxoglutarate dehydrogenase complex dihydrolipoyllysine-residue succinyltransferase [Arenicella chitinivorans]GHA21426.1 dihydrolipoyllysine-residue succinyltransferase component of 2-oxoglutarate dehydrogenase complex [Arenicella chitinivorans]